MQKYFSYEVIVSTLTTKENDYEVRADKENLKYLKDLLDVEEVVSFDSKMSLKSDKNKNILTVSGIVNCEVILKSVVSLENFSQKYNLAFEVKYDLSANPNDFDGVEFDGSDEILDVVVDGKIDLADIAIEQVVLSIDENPRIEGEVFEFLPEFEVDEKPNPFKVLEKLKK